MTEPCTTLSWFPNHDPLQVGETYQFTAACSDPGHTVRGHYSCQGSGPVGVPFAGTGASATFNVTIPAGCQGVVVTARCYAQPGDKDWVCEDFHSLNVG